MTRFAKVFGFFAEAYLIAKSISFFIQGDILTGIVCCCAVVGAGLAISKLFSNN